MYYIFITGAIAWLLVGFILSFGSLAISIWLLFEIYIVPGMLHNALLYYLTWVVSILYFNYKDYFF